MTTAYERFATVLPVLMAREPDRESAPLLGQAFADVIDLESTSRELDDLMSLLTIRRDEPSGEADSPWASVLSALLGVLRQHLHHRQLRETSRDSNNPSVRARILMALAAGVTRPSEIADRVGSPATVVSRTLSALVADGQVKGPTSDPLDRRYRRYELVSLEYEKPTQPRLSAETDQLGNADLIMMARKACRINASLALPYLDQLSTIGRDRRLQVPVRADALSTACVVMRSHRRLHEARVLAEQLCDLGSSSDDAVVKARGIYEVSRIQLEENVDRAAVGVDLDAAMESLTPYTSSAANYTSAWLRYTRAAMTPTGVGAGIGLLLASNASFADVKDEYGCATTHMLLARFYSKQLNSVAGLNHAKRGLEIAEREGFARPAAECALWMGSLSRAIALSSQSITGTVDSSVVWLQLAAHRFDGLEMHAWGALARCELILAQAISAETKIGPDSAELVEARDRVTAEVEMVEPTPTGQKSWAAASLYRHLAVLNRMTERSDEAIRWFTASQRIYRNRADASGMAITAAGIKSAQGLNRTIGNMVVETVENQPVGIRVDASEFAERVRHDPLLELCGAG